MVHLCLSLTLMLAEVTCSCQLLLQAIRVVAFAHVSPGFVLLEKETRQQKPSEHSHLSSRKTSIAFDTHVLPNPHPRIYGWEHKWGKKCYQSPLHVQQFLGETVRGFRCWNRKNCCNSIHSGAPRLAKEGGRWHAVRMRHRATFIALAALLAGCSPGYDIDVSCDYLSFRKCDRNRIEECTSELTLLTCYSVPSFDIRCDAETVQSVGDTYLCTTHDGRRVRVKLEH
jgi:hypothetical protein